MMGRLGKAHAGPAATFRLGKAEYDVVLVPPLDTVRATTLDLLREFTEAGGTVVFCRPVPTHVDARSGTGAAELADSCQVVPFEREAILAAIEPARVVSIRGEDGEEKPGVFYLLHREGDESRLFICNRDRTEGTGPLTVALEAEGNVQLWDAESGQLYSLPSRREGEGVQFATHLPPSGSRLLVVTPVAEELPPLPRLAEVRSIRPAEGAWTSELTEPNVLVLDTAEYEVNWGGWLGPHEILKADQEIRKIIGLAPRGGRMVQPWARGARDGLSGQVALLYRFRVDELPPGPLMLAMESPHRFKISLNGQLIPPDNDAGWWVDPSIRLLPLDEAVLVRGENALLMAGEMDQEMDLEACYLLGEFAVRLDGANAAIAGGLPVVRFGDWTEQGLPFYAGSVVFRTEVALEPAEGERVFVEVPQFAGACVRVLVGGREAGIIGWQPHEVEITDFVADKPIVDIAVEVISHRRNAFGPLHHTQTRPRYVGPHTFITRDEEWQDEYSLVPAGCLAPPRVSVRRAE
jgi:hypothetical protein